MNKMWSFCGSTFLPNLSVCLSSCNYALILLKTFGFVAELRMMMVCNSKSFQVLKCMSGSNFSHGWFLCDNHKCNKCWFSCLQHLLVLFFLFLFLAAIHKIYALEMMNHQCILECLFFIFMNHAKIYSIVWERHVDQG